MTENPNTSRPQFGVTGMKARARSLDGTIRTRTAPGKGTELEVLFPWKAPLHEEDAHPVG